MRTSANAESWINGLKTRRELIKLGFKANAKGRLPMMLAWEDKLWVDPISTVGVILLSWRGKPDTLTRSHVTRMLQNYGYEVRFV